MDEKIMIRFNGDNRMFSDLMTAWLEDEGVTIRIAGREYTVDLTYVK